MQRDRREGVREGASRERYSRGGQAGEQISGKKSRRQRELERRRQEERRRKLRRKARRRVLFRTALVLAAAAVIAVLGRKAFTLLEQRQGINPDKLAEEGYPESLIELVQKNPETKEFVLNYPKYQGEQEIDVSEEVKEGALPLFLQWDERWGYEKYGSDFLAVTGCGPTCLSMVVCGLTGSSEWNPLKTARWAQEQGFYVEGSGSSWELMTAGAEALGLTVSEVIFDAEHIRSTLEAGTPIICVVGPGDFTTAGHFLVLTGVDENGDILLHDPNSPMRTEKAWDVDTLMSQMKNLWSYTYSA